MSPRPDHGLLPGLPPPGGGAGFLRKAAAVVTGTVLVVLGIAFSVVFLAVAAVGAVAVWGYLAWKTRALRRTLNDARASAAGPNVIEGVAVELPTIRIDALAASRMKLLNAFALAATLLTGPAVAQVASPYAIDIPPWFATSFLDFRDEVADAARAGRRVMIYVGQDGCPYCTKLMTANFSQADIVATTRERFVPIALNLWGDREATWVDGRAQTEKALAQRLGVQFTPTLIFLDEGGNVVARLDGYWPPQRFRAVLDYVATKRETVEPLADWLAVHAKETPRPPRADEPFLMRAPLDLAKRKGGKPLAVLVESADCEACDEMHREAFGRRDVLRELERFDVARVVMGSSAPLTSPSGKATTAGAFARELGVAYTPAVVFFDASGGEVFRIGAYLRPFHFASSFAYVADGAYRDEPSFQRWLRDRADRMRARGQRVELWE